MISTSATIGELVVERAERATLFERLGLDYCCGGDRTLAVACAVRELDPQLVVGAIEAFDAATAAAPAQPEPHDLSGATLTEICDHIESAHHDWLRRELPQIAELLDSVIRVHAPVHPELHSLVPLFADLRDELESHLDDEERVLFPAARSTDRGDAATALDEATLDTYEHEHEHVGELLGDLRDLTNGFDADAALCRTHRRLVEGLHALELDLHRHIHEENNILLPRLRSTAGVSSTRSQRESSTKWAVADR
jgi:regulator of cell morphogenesis and NO signaling